MLLVEKWYLLDTVVRSASDFRGTSGEERTLVLVYAEALQTGRRTNEIASLTSASLRFNRNCLFVVVEARGTKKRKVAWHYVSPTLSDWLDQHDGSGL